MAFASLGLIPPLLRAVADEGYEQPSPIQLQAIPPLLAGRDLIGISQTGTGKTAAFALPLLQRMISEAPPSAPRGGPRPIRTLVLTPTRELAAQVAASFDSYGRHLRLSCATIYGGVGATPQIQALRRGVDTVVACPGRLLDLMDQGHVKLDRVSALVLDEADRMFDMGFLPSLKRIIKRLPHRRQNLLFSATMPDAIRALAEEMLHDPAQVSVAAVSSAAETVSQSVYYVDKPQKIALLKALLGDHHIGRTLVFTRTKHGADKVVRLLEKGGIRSAAIHGNKSQGQRIRALEDFRSGKVRVLVASDLAARGLDIDAVSHVVNFDIPNEPETYVHRIGRTGRAGATGIAWSFCDMDEKKWLAGIERTIGMRLPANALPPLPESAPSQPASSAGRNQSQRPPGQGKRQTQGTRNDQAGGAGGRSAPKPTRRRPPRSR